MSKYAAIYFIICILVYIFSDTKFRKILLGHYFGFFISFFCIIIISLPNIIWNLNTNWVTFIHTSDNANLQNIDYDIVRGLIFLCAQILMLGPFLFLGNIVNFTNVNINQYQKLMLVFSLPIILIVFIEAVVVRANANWAAPALISLYVFLYTGITNLVIQRVNIIFNFVFCFIFFLLIGINYPSTLFNRISGISEFSQNIYLKGHNNNIVNIVVSDRLLFANMGYILKNKNVRLHMPYEENTKITNHFKISSALEKKMDKNFILIGSLDDIKYLENNFVTNKIVVPEYAFIKKEVGVYEVLFN